MLPMFSERTKIVPATSPMISRTTSTSPTRIRRPRRRRAPGMGPVPNSSRITAMDRRGRWFHPNSCSQPWSPEPLLSDARAWWAPPSRTMARTVRTMIWASRARVRFSAWRRSRADRFLPGQALRPLTCHRPVLPGLTRRRRRAYSATSRGSGGANPATSCRRGRSPAAATRRSSTAQNGTDSSDPGIVAHLEQRPGDLVDGVQRGEPVPGVDHHRAEPDHPELAAVAAHALQAEEHRAAVRGTATARTSMTGEMRTRMSSAPARSRALEQLGGSGERGVGEAQEGRPSTLATCRRGPVISTRPDRRRAQCWFPGAPDEGGHHFLGPDGEHAGHRPSGGAAAVQTLTQHDASDDGEYAGSGHDPNTRGRLSGIWMARLRSPSATAAPSIPRSSGPNSTDPWPRTVGFQARDTESEVAASARTSEAVEAGCARTHCPGGHSSATRR